MERPAQDKVWLCDNKSLSLQIWRYDTFLYLDHNIFTFPSTHPSINHLFMYQAQPLPGLACIPFTNTSFSSGFGNSDRLMDCLLCSLL